LRYFLHDGACKKIMTEERIIAYLLEELPEADLEQFEDECFAEEDWPIQVNLVEEDLIDAYLRNQLTPERRQRFELNYLTTDARQERIIMAAALLRHVDEYNAPPSVIHNRAPSWTERIRAFWRRPVWVTAVATMAAIVIAASVFIFSSRTPEPQTFTKLNLAISDSNRSEGVDSGRVKTPIGTDALEVSLTLPQSAMEATRYRAELDNLSRNDGNSDSLNATKKDAQSVVVVILSKQLVRGQYALKLYATKADGVEERVPGSYLFTVE
jgi:hypothetical protein